MTGEVPQIAWPVASLVPPPSQGEIHVWAWSLVADPDTVRELRALLDPEERARADRFVFDRDRVRFTVAHARLRRILSECLSKAADRLVFRAGSHGKPELANDVGLRFNLTHSGELALLAISRDLELGVDVEDIRPLSDDAIADRFFSEPEVRALRAVAPQSRLAAFYSCWTRKEAVLKGTGMGLSGGLDSFAVSIAGDDPPTITSLRGDETAGWMLAPLEPAVGYIGALAVKGRDWRIDTRSLPASFR